MQYLTGGQKLQRTSELTEPLLSLEQKTPLFIPYNQSYGLPVTHPHREQPRGSDRAHALPTELPGR